MVGPMRDNDGLSADPSRDVARAPRCDATYAATYRRNIGLRGDPDPALAASRGAEIGLAGLFAALLAPLRPERYLTHALLTWLGERLESHHSARAYLRAMRGWIRTTGWRRLDWQAQRANPRALAEYRDQLAQRGAPRSVNAQMTVLRSWYTWLQEMGLIARSPWRRDHLVSVDRARLYHGNRVGHVRRRLTEAQARELVAWCFAEVRIPKVAVALLLMACTGLRRGEVVGADLDWLYQDGDDRCITVRGKGNRSRSLILDPIVVRAIDRHLAHHEAPGRPPTRGPLLRGRGDNRLHPETVARWVGQFGRTIGRPDLTPHELRRTYATLIRDRGVSLEYAQRQLGHASPALTQDYYDVGDRRLRVTLDLSEATT